MQDLSFVLIALFIVVTTVGWWLALSDLGRRHDLAGWHKTASALVVLLLPILGALAYYIFRPASPSSRVQRPDDPYAAEQLAVFADLRRKGVISADEYDRERAALVGVGQLQTGAHNAAIWTSATDN